MKFLEISLLRDRVSKIKSLNKKVELLSQFFKRLSEDEIEIATRFLIGRIFSPKSHLVLDMSWKTIREVKAFIKERKSGSLSINDVYLALCEIANVKGKGSKDKKRKILKTLMEKMDEKEESFLINCIFSELRQGVKEGVMRKAISSFLRISPSLIQRAEMFLSDLGEVAKIGAIKGKEGLEKIGINLFIPVEPMLAEVSENIREVLKYHKGKTAIEYKFDGVRVQIHKKGEDIKIFSRRLKEITKSLPDIVKIVKDNIRREEEFIVEGEVVAYDRNYGPLPFQNLMKRFRRIKDIDIAIKQIPTHLYLFDILYRDKQSLVDLPYEDRRKILENIVSEEYISKRYTLSTEEEIEEVLKQAIREGHEGIVAKNPKSLYTPGIRGRSWFKIKKFQTLDLVIIAAEWGHGRRENWLSNYWLAVRDEENLKMVGKTFKGLSDEEFIQITKSLLKIVKEEKDYIVFVEPKIVVEVAFNEVQRSPHYSSGFALRFARILRIRWDKSPNEIDTLQTLRKLYNMQFLHNKRLLSF